MSAKKVKKATVPLSWIAPDLRSLAVPIETLEPDPENARVHGEANLAATRRSLAQHGQRKVLVVHDGVVMAGNGTLEVAKDLGWTHLAVARYHGTREAARHYALADNRTAELASWHPERLAATIEEAEKAGCLDATAFDRAELDQFRVPDLDDSPTPPRNPAVPPETPPAGTTDLHQVVLVYGAQEAVEVENLLAAARAKADVPDNTAAVSKALQAYLGAEE